MPPLESDRITRLAPSPTGALHLGNARTFAINWALARQRGWRVILRIEDLDGPRVKPGADQQAIDDLQALKGQIPGLLSVDAGRNFSDRAGNYNFAAVMTLEDKDALAGYGPHPAHQAVAGRLGGLANGLMVVDFEI